MSKFLGLREEHMDLFGTLASGSYTSGHTFTSSETSEVSGNVLQKMAPEIAHWKAKLMVTAKAGTGVTMTLKVYGANSLNDSGEMVSPVTLVTVAGLDAATAGKMIYDSVLPNGYEYYKVSLTPSAAATGCKVEGWVEPEFN